ncbi:MAG: hypothetical protein ACXWL2_05130 [Candidatus Chromulinivorax sp.]
MKKLISVTAAICLFTSFIITPAPSPVTFTNKSCKTITLTGPRGSKSIKPEETFTIQKPAGNTVEYTIKAQGYQTYQGSAEAGKKYIVNGCNNDANQSRFEVVLQ